MSEPEGTLEQIAGNTAAHSVSIAVLANRCLVVGNGAPRLQRWWSARIAKVPHERRLVRDAAETMAVSSASESMNSLSLLPAGMLPSPDPGVGWLTLRQARGLAGSPSGARSSSVQVSSPEIDPVTRSLDQADDRRGVALASLAADARVVVSPATAAVGPDCERDVETPRGRCAASTSCSPRGVERVD